MSIPQINPVVQGNPQAAIQQGIAALNPIQNQGQQPKTNPGGPVDIGDKLRALIEASKILEIKKAAQNQQMMAAGDPPPVAQQIAQGLEAVNAQDAAKMAPAPTMMARGGSVGIDRLPSHMDFAGGGIVGFYSGSKGPVEGDTSKGYDPEEWDSYEQYLTAKTKAQDAQQVSPVEAMKRLALMIRHGVGLGDYPTDGAPPAPAAKEVEPAAFNPNDPSLQTNNAPGASRSERDARGSPLPVPQPAKVVAASSASSSSRTSTPEKEEAPSGLRLLIENAMKGHLGRNSDAERDAQQKWSDDSLRREPNRQERLAGEAEYAAGNDAIKKNRQGSLDSLLEHMASRKAQWGETGAHAAQGAANAMFARDKQMRGYYDDDQDMLAKQIALREKRMTQDQDAGKAGITAGIGGREDAEKAKTSAMSVGERLLANDDSTAWRKQDAAWKHQDRKDRMAAAAAGGSGSETKILELHRKIRKDINESPAIKDLEKGKLSAAIAATNPKIAQMNAAVDAKIEQERRRQWADVLKQYPSMPPPPEFSAPTAGAAAAAPSGVKVTRIN
jgi:hypothetical protein